MTNPFVYGEVVPASAFVDREEELDRLTRDLLAGQKVFLISPRRFGKSSLVQQALRAAARGGALVVDVTVSSYSSYVAFLEGYAAALSSVERQAGRAVAWLREMLSAVSPELRIDTAPGGRPHAEEQAVPAAGEAARGATAYVTMEPCGARSSGRTSCCLLYTSPSPRDRG